MLLFVDPSIPMITSGSRRLNPGTYFDLEGYPGHMFRVRREPNSIDLVAEIKKDGKIVHTGKIPWLSRGTGGLHPRGGTITKPYEIDLHPDQPVFPLLGITSRMASLGLSHLQINPIVGNQLEDWAYLSGSPDPRMVSDVRVNVITRDKWRRFTLKNASWAINYRGKNITHAYVWPSVLEGGRSRKLLAAIRKVQAGLA